MKQENEMLRQKFKMLKYQTLTELVKNRRSPLSAETYAAVLLRDSTPALRTLMIMMVDLGFSKADIAKTLRARGERVIADLICEDEEMIAA